MLLNIAWGIIEDHVVPRFIAVLEVVTAGHVLVIDVLSENPDLGTTRYRVFNRGILPGLIGLAAAIMLPTGTVDIRGFPGPRRVRILVALLQMTAVRTSSLVLHRVFGKVLSQRNHLLPQTSHPSL